MTIKRRDPEFLHPDTVAQLQGLTDEEAAKHSPIIRERDGVFMQQRRVGRRVRCREVEASGVPALETGALHAAAEAEFGRSLPLLTAEFLGDGVPDLDAIETMVRDGVLGGGAKCYAALLEAVDARLAGKSRPSCPPGGGWSGAAGSARRSGRASERLGSSGAISSAASAASDPILWTARCVWRARESRPGRKPSTPTPPVPTVMRKRGASCQC